MYYRIKVWRIIINLRDFSFWFRTSNSQFELIVLDVAVELTVLDVSGLSEHEPQEIM